MNEMNQRFCQCCSMPMGETNERYGTNADGSKNEEYCSYCYENGKFTFSGTMEEMIEICIPPMVAANPNMSEEEARKIMLEWFPTLKRWRIEDNPLYERFAFRTIRQEEAGEAADIESVCFPANEACSRENMTSRIKVASDLFLVAIDRESGKMAGFLNGIATNEMSFRDEFFTDAAIHDPEGKNVMLLGLDVLPEYRRQGLGRELVFHYCRRERARGRERLVLTCLEDKVKMYTKLGFRDLGESASEWGGEKWHEMDVFLCS